MGSEAEPESNFVRGAPSGLVLLPGDGKTVGSEAEPGPGHTAGSEAKPLLAVLVIR